MQGLSHWSAVTPRIWGSLRPAQTLRVGLTVEMAAQSQQATWEQPHQLVVLMYG